MHNIGYYNIMSPNRRPIKENKVARMIINFIIVLLVLVVAVKSYELKQKKNEYAQREAYLSEEIAKEEERAEKIAEYETYTKTKAYVEEIARDKLGLVYEGELLFKDESKSK